jgi:hypothetical protein
MKTCCAKTKTAKVPFFVRRAERAFCRAAKNLRLESAMTGIPLVLGINGRACFEYYVFANNSRKVILRRTITLKDAWAKEAKKG